MVASAFSIVREFVTHERDTEPRELLGEPTWQAMLKVADVYAAEKKLCEESIEKAEWSNEVVKDGVAEVTCSECGSDLVQAGNKSESWLGSVLVCRACGSEMEPCEYVPTAIRAGLSHEMYVAVTDGDEIPSTDCPHRGEEAYLVSEQQCAACGESAEHPCARCGNEIPVSELGTASLCGYCDHMMHKDDSPSTVAATNFLPSRRFGCAGVCVGCATMSLMLTAHSADKLAAHAHRKRIHSTEGSWPLLRAFR